MKTVLRRASWLIAAALALAGIAAAATTPSVTITNPRSGSSVSLTQNPNLDLAGTASFASTAGGTPTTFYLRRDGCGTANDNPHLSIVNGTDAGDGCGLVINGVTGLGGDADQAAFIDFPASDGTPVALNGKQAITGVIALTGAQVGLAEVDVDVSALVKGNAVDLGSTTATATLDPTATSTPVPFTIPASPSLNGSDLQALDLRVLVHGPNVYSGFMALSGASYLKVPSFAASVHRGVSVSVDGHTKAWAHLSGSTWTLNIQTPAVGKHTITATAIQGYSTSNAAKSTFTVTK